MCDESRADFGDPMRERELEARDEQLLDVGPADVLRLLDLNHTENMDGSEPRTMPGSHILIVALDGIRARELTVLLVHVVCTRARVITDPNTEVLDLQRLLFMNNVDADDFTIGFFDLLQLPEEVPEPRLRDDLIRRKDAHTIDFRSRLGLRRQMTPDDLIFLKAHVE